MSSLHALILGGGTARRLGGMSKPDVEYQGRRLLDHVLTSLPDAVDGRRVVVAPDSVAVPHDVLRALENPPFGGPVAGIAAGLSTLEPEPGDLVAILACDAPRAGEAIPALLGALSAGSTRPAGAVPGEVPGAVSGAAPSAVPDADPDAVSGAVPGTVSGAAPSAASDAVPDADPDAVSGAVPGTVSGAAPSAASGAVPAAEPGSHYCDATADCAIGRDAKGREQYLLGVYRAAALTTRIEQWGSDDLAGAPVWQFISALRPIVVDLPAALTHDIDTPADLAPATRDEGTSLSRATRDGGPSTGRATRDGAGTAE